MDGIFADGQKIYSRAQRATDQALDLHRSACLLAPRGQGQGWLTAEYGMSPRSTGTRMDREAARGKQTGRTAEIQRLIGRSLRAAVDLLTIGENTIHVDCDVIQADGGTRTASITGAWVALADAIAFLKRENQVKGEPLKRAIASVSVGIYEGQPVLDL